MRCAIVGCGYVADFYFRTLQNHTNLELIGVFDRNLERCSRFANFYNVYAYDSLQAVLNDRNVELIVNLTNPQSHYCVTKAALSSGKHVYTEKPLALSLQEAEELVDLAKKSGLTLSGAPCNLLSETAQTLWKALREGRIGTPRLVYAELDDGIVFLDYEKWVSASGAPWPFKNEFETGCTLEHAGYYIGWLVAFFGPAKRIISSTSTLLETKGSIVGSGAPDFVVGCIEFASGPVARFTSGIYATRDRSLRIFGDEGILSTSDCWDYGAPVYLERRIPVSWRERHPRRAMLLGMKRPALQLVRPITFTYPDGANKMDFCRGIAELADAVLENREPRLSARWMLHVNEITLKMCNGDGSARKLETVFQPIAPMPWAA